MKAGVEDPETWRGWAGVRSREEDGPVGQGVGGGGRTGTHQW